MKPTALNKPTRARPKVVESYHCSFGLHPDYRSLLEQGAMRITGVDINGEVRVMELVAHPFFIGTLFQPELSAFVGVAHPLIVAFLQNSYKFLLC